MKWSLRNNLPSISPLPHRPFLLAAPCALHPSPPVGLWPLPLTRSVHSASHSSSPDSKHSFSADLPSAACRRSFVSPDKPLDAALYASFEELRAVCHTWGLYGVKELASRSEAVLAEAMAILDTALRMHEPLLQRLKTEYLVHLLTGSCAS